MIQPSELAGGAGFSFEDAVVAAYLGALLGEESALGLNDRIVSRVAVQQAAFGEPLDDLIVDGRGPDESCARVSLEVKRKLTISAAPTNRDFHEIVIRSWQTLQKPDFRENIDRVGTVTGTVSEASRRTVNELCEWARASTTLQIFSDRFKPGTPGAARRAVLQTFATILSDYSNGKVGDGGVYRLLQHFVLIKFDGLHEGAIDESHAIERLRAHLRNPDHAADLWARLRVIAREGAGRRAEFNRVFLLHKLHGAFHLVGARSLRRDLAVTSEEAGHSLATIAFEIDGVEIKRSHLVAKAKAALETHRFVNIVGLPGVGKSAALRAFAKSEQQRGSILVLKSDRLTGSSWSTYATDLGLSASNVEALLSEIAAAGSSVLFIDGIDRVEVPNRGIVLDLLNAILGSPLLGNWKVLTTSRDNGIEPLRTWLPMGLLANGGIATVEVSALNHQEADQLAQARPALRALLFGEERVREIARRPFFTAVFARSVTQDLSAVPRSEVELIDAWWARGGYDSEAVQGLRRQRALIQLAKSGAANLGRRIRLDGIDPDALGGLKTDGVIKDVSVGHTVQFAHDIFFEWSFLHLLMERNDAWLEEIQAVGEPPVLGRAVELLSQTTFTRDEAWEDNLARLEVAPTRPQWVRARLVAPWGIPTFWDLAQTVTDAVFRDDARRFTKLAVWFQAEKTKANPNVLDRGAALEHLSHAEILRIADALAWPSDLATWDRFCNWALQNLQRVPVAAIPDVVSVFEVWQNALANVPHGVSARIIEAVTAWLEDIEDRERPEELRLDHGVWTALESSERKELEERLRSLLIRSAPVEEARVRGYLCRIQERRHLRHHTFSSIIAFTSILATHHAQDVSDLMLTELKDELPGEMVARTVSHGEWPHSFSYHDWDHLAIRYSRVDFFPASPLREPFASLFQVAPDTARALVRQLTNHAITAWRQLFTLDPDRRATPLQLTLEFPWGVQEFWGDGKVYVWSRGHWGPGAVLCGLMGLEHWAFSEIERGRNADDVIRDVLDGHTSCAVLNIATALALSSNHTSPTTLPIATSQKVWEWDIARVVQDSSAQANLVGFINPSDLQHAKAVRAENERPARRIDVRRLAQLFVLNADARLRSAAREAITCFAAKLAFTFEEERADGGHVGSLRRRAEIWSEVGNIENYVVTPVEDGKSVRIDLASPTASDPDVVAIKSRGDRMHEQLTLLNWIWDSFEKTSLSERLTLTDAIERAKKLDRADLFQEAHSSMTDDDMDRSAVAGAASITILYGDSVGTPHLGWANDVLLRAATTPEHRGEMWFAGSHLVHHPCLYSARGLGGLVRRGFNTSTAKETLLRLAGHPLEAVSIDAIATALSLWSLDGNLALIALNLGIRIAIGSMDVRAAAYGYDHAAAAERLALAVDNAIGELRSGRMRTALCALPAPWVFAPPRPRVVLPLEARPERKSVWRDPDEFLRWDFLPKVLPHVPIAAAMNDAQRRPILLAFCYDLLKWILERVNPSWKEDNEERRERPSTETFELRTRVLWLLGQVALYLEPEEAQRHILDPMFALDDETAASVIRPFADSVTASGIIDPPMVSPQALALLEACVRRVLKDRAWDRARRREGDIYGFDLPELVRICLFVTIEYAGGASRFANRDWHDIKLILPVVDLFVRNVGDVPHVASSFLTLCERAEQHYPAETFSGQMTMVVGKQPGTPVGWRHTTIPSRIASLIHKLAEWSQPLSAPLAQSMLRVLDRLVDMGDRRSAALQTSEIFKNVRF